MARHSFKIPGPVAQLFGQARYRRRRIARSALLVVLFCLLLQTLLAYMLENDTRLLPAELQRARSVMLVTAHPDDECLFFAPSVLGVLASSGEIKGSLLVMSSGNNYGLGETRKKEVLGSCQALGIQAERCMVLDHPKLQDNPKEWWDTDLIQSIVEKHVAEWDVEVIITFDEGGVSGHINHRAVSAAISNYVKTGKGAPIAYELITTSVLRKYISLLDLPLTALPYTWRIFLAFMAPSRRPDPSHSSGAVSVNTWRQYGQTRQAFASHGTQYSWDRHLYMVLSRYVWFNSLRRMPGVPGVPGGTPSG